MQKEEINYLKKLIDVSDKTLDKLKKAKEERKPETFKKLRESILDLQNRILEVLK